MNLLKIVRAITVTTISLSLTVGCGNSGGGNASNPGNPANPGNPGNPGTPVSPTDPANPGGNLGGFVNPARIELLSSGNYAILAKTGISSVPSSIITGDIAVSPNNRASITGFSDILDASTTFSLSNQVTGKIYAADMTDPTPSMLTTDVSAMEAAYTDGENRPNPDKLELLDGNIVGVSFGRGLYKWTNTVLVNGDIYISGSSTDVVIFQIAGGLTFAAGAKVILQGGILAKNVFYVVAETVEMGAGAHLEGVVLGYKHAALLTGATMNGRLLMQTAVTLDQSTVTEPAQ